MTDMEEGDWFEIDEESYHSLEIQCMKCGVIMTHEEESDEIKGKRGIYYTCPKCKHRIVVFNRVI